MRGHLLLLSLCLAIAAPAAAQQINVAATVPTNTPTGAGTRNLLYGTVVPAAGGSVVSIVPAAAAPLSATVQSGEFRYVVTATRGLDFNITAPVQLAAAGRPPLVVSSNGVQYGGHCVRVDGSACTLTNFNPVTTPQVRICAQTLGNGNCHPNRVFGAGSELAVYVGGSLTVPPHALPGSYTGVVTLTITQVY